MSYMKEKYASIQLYKTVISVVLLTFLSGNILNAQVVTDGLVGYWSFNQATIKEKIVKDIWGNNDATINGDPQVIQGKVHEALEFDGVDDSIVIPDAEPVRLGKTGSFELWVKLKKINEYQGIFVKAVAWTGSGYVLRYSSKFQFQGGWEWVDFHEDGVLKVDQWSHVVMATDGEIAFLYQDGKLVVSEETKVAASTQPLIIGETFSYFLNGFIDEVRIYDRVLSEDEIKQNMNTKGLSVHGSPDKLTITWATIKVQ